MNIYKSTRHHIQQELKLDVDICCIYGQKMLLRFRFDLRRGTFLFPETLATYFVFF